MGADIYSDYLRGRDKFVADSSAPSYEGKNFIWILSDAVRADHLPMYGYSRNTTPNLKIFSDRSLLFLHNYVQGPNTVTSLADQLTGYYTSSLKSKGGIEKVQTIGEAFRSKGYSTWAILQKFDLKALKAKSKNGTMFDRVFSKKRYSAPAIVKKAVSLIKQREKDKPFFLFVFFYETHGPYKKHAGFDYGDKPIDRYDSDISFVDKHIGELLEFVDREGLADDTVVAISSDHGEELGQHGGWGHQWKVYNCLLHVPFILHLPGTAPRRVGTPVQSIDLFPSIAKLMNLDVSSSLDGSSFTPFLMSDDAPHSPLIISEAETSQAREVSLISYPWKIDYHISDTYFSLYNLENDPLENIDRIDLESSIAGNLKNYLLSWLSYRDKQMQHLDASNPEVTSVLKSLRSFDCNSLESLDSLEGLRINAEDFDMLAKALSPYYSPVVAAKLVELSQHDKQKWVSSLRGLGTLASRADREIGESPTGDKSEASSAIVDALSTDAALDFLYDAAKEKEPDHFKPALQAIGLIRPPALRAKVLGLYLETDDPVKKSDLLETLGRLGETTVENQLLDQYEKYIGTNRSLTTLPMVVSYKSERSRRYLLDLLKKKPRSGYQILEFPMWPRSDVGECSMMCV